MMELDKEKVLQFVKKQKKPLLFGGVILLVLFVTLAIPSGKKAPSIGGVPPPTNKPFNPFGLFGKEQKEEKTAVNTQEAVEKSLNNIHSGNPSAPIPTGIVRINPNGTKTTQSVGTGGTIRTAQGTISLQSNIQSGVNSNDQADILRIVFRNPDGSTTSYIPPGTPPNEVRWGRYTNDRFNYAINYPVNWQFFYTIDADGHEGIALYPPYVNVNDPKSPYVGFGLTERFLLPTLGNTANALITPIRVDGVSGDLYTEGPLGPSYMASVFQYNGKYFGLGSSISDATFAYVYYYMLYSLTFNTQ
jgi:hypothetical protein